MVVIGYGVCGEGMGHATRARIVVNALLAKGHEVHIFASGRAYEFLKDKYDNVYRIKPFNLVYKEDKLLAVKSSLKIIESLPVGLLSSFRKIAKILSEKRASVVITDHEALTGMVAKGLRIPLISTSNINIIDKTTVEQISLRLAIPKLFNIVSNKVSNFRADYYVIPTFFYPKRKSKNVFLTAPAVREDIKKVKPKRGKHILVYHTTPTVLKKMIKALSVTDEQYVVYGFGKQKDLPNVKFYEFSEKEFIKNLATSKAVMTGGGFSLISEALYYKKPILSMPVKDHFEQITNAYYIQKKRFGMIMNKFSSDTVVDFLLQLPRYNYYLDRHDFDADEYVKRILSIVNKEAKKEHKINKIWLRAVERIVR